jgi:hypothetical protein
LTKQAFFTSSPSPPIIYQLFSLSSDQWRMGQGMVVVSIKKAKPYLFFSWEDFAFYLLALLF